MSEIEAKRQQVIDRARDLAMTILIPAINIRKLDFDTVSAWSLRDWCEILHVSLHNPPSMTGETIPGYAIFRPLFSAHTVCGHEIKVSACDPYVQMGVQYPRAVRCILYPDVAEGGTIIRVMVMDSETTWEWKERDLRGNYEHHTYTATGTTLKVKSPDDPIVQLSRRIAKPGKIGMVIKGEEVTVPLPCYHRGPKSWFKEYRATRVVEAYQRVGIPVVEVEPPQYLELI